MMGCQYPTHRMFVFMAHKYFRVCVFKNSTCLPLLIKQLSISIWPIRHNYWGITTFSFYTVQKWKRYHHKKRPSNKCLTGKKTMKTTCFSPVDQRGVGMTSKLKEFRGVHVESTLKLKAGESDGKWADDRRLSTRNISWKSHQWQCPSIMHVIFVKWIFMIILWIYRYTIMYIHSFQCFQFHRSVQEAGVDSFNQWSSLWNTYPTSSLFGKVFHRRMIPDI